MKEIGDSTNLARNLFDQLRILGHRLGGGRIEFVRLRLHHGNIHADGDQ